MNVLEQSSAGRIAQVVAGSPDPATFPRPQVSNGLSETRGPSKCGGQETAAQPLDQIVTTVNRPIQGELQTKLPPSARDFTVFRSVILEGKSTRDAAWMSHISQTRV